MASVLDYPTDPINTTELVRVHAALKPFANCRNLSRSSEMIDVIRDPRFQSCIGRLIENICTDPIALRLCAQRSQSHPLGFDKVAIVSTAQYQIRLNYWPSSTLHREFEDIHDHRFDFVSVVLSGSLTAELYEVTAVGDIVDHYIDHVPMIASDPYILELAGQVKVQKVSAHRLTAGSAYVTRFDSLHRIIAEPGESVVTLFVKFAPKRSEANVMRPHSLTSNRSSLARRLYTPTEIVATLREILQLTGI